MRKLFTLLLILCDNKYVSSPYSNPKQATVESSAEPGELTEEELQAFIPTNLRIAAENSTYTLDVTVTWDNPENASMIQFYEIENGLLNGTRVYPFDGVAQHTIVQGDGTEPYEYQTVNGTNILRFSVIFHEEYDASEPKLDRERMLGRLENYISGLMGLMGLLDRQYPGLVVSWDVVNEAIDD